MDYTLDENWRMNESTKMLTISKKQNMDLVVQAKFKITCFALFNCSGLIGSSNNFKR